VTLAFGLDFFYYGSLISFSPFPCVKTPWIFKSSSLAHSLVLPGKCQNRMTQNRKPDSPVFQTCQIWSSTWFNHGRGSPMLSNFRNSNLCFVWCPSAPASALPNLCFVWCPSAPASASPSVSQFLGWSCWWPFPPFCGGATEWSPPLGVATSALDTDSACVLSPVTWT
jgi:hypothetical protein